MLKTGFVIFLSLFLVEMLGANSSRVMDADHATAFVQALTEQDVIKLEKIHDSNQQVDFQKKLDALFRQEATTPVVGTKAQLLGAEHSNASFFKESAFHYRVTFPSGSKHILLLVVRQTSDGKEGFSIIGKVDSPDQSDGAWFPVKGRRIFQYILLLFGFAFAIFILVMALVCFRMKPKGRWFWILLILTGFTRLDMNWTSGTMTFVPFSLVLFGIQVQRVGGLAPWIISLSPPLGAVFFYWFKVRPNK